MLRSILAVFAGFVTIFLLVGLADFLYLRFDPGAFTGTGMPIGTTVILITVAYLEVINVIGGYVTATIARQAPTLYALILGAIGFAITLTVAIVQWQVAPHSYLIATTILVLPMCLLGGTLRSKTQ